jgi:ABC-type uncharacterized transport system substrate-binding protein
MMKKTAVFLGISFALAYSFACKEKSEPSPPPKPSGPYEIVIFQSADSPTGEAVRRGILRALRESGLREGEDVRAYVRIADSGLSEVQAVAQELAASEIDLIMPLSTACLQAVIIAGDTKPVVFSSVANPFLVGAGRSAVDHLSFVTGVASTAPIRQTLQFIHETMPAAGKIGTLWTPSEINSEYYLDLIREAGTELNLQIVAEPVANAHEIPRAAQALVNGNVDLIFPVSDNTINSAFKFLSDVANERGLPLFGGVLQAVEIGACAAMGFDFNEMGFKAGKLAIRVMNGESPGQIPFQYMDQILIHINLEAAAKQGIIFAEEILRRAAVVIQRAFPAARSDALPNDSR